MNLNDTIVAQSTPQGKGAIGIIRLSGKNSITIINSIFPSKDLSKEKSHTCLLYTSPSPRDISGSRMPSSA